MERATALLILVWLLIAVGLPWWIERIDALGIAGAGFPLAYWLSAQGALLGFLGIVLACALWMERLDARHLRDADAARPPPAPPVPHA